jgi:hypothetical protein
MISPDVCGRRKIGLCGNSNRSRIIRSEPITGETANGGALAASAEAGILMENNTRRTSYNRRDISAGA